MNAKKFFLDSIHDNNYQGISLVDNVDPKWEDDIFHNKKRNKEKFRKEGISNFLKELHRKIANKKISELNLTQIIFDEEFEANEEQRIFELRGNDFNDLKIYTGNIVGSIVYKNRNFNINCRFGNGFLQYMIANTSGFLELENLGSINRNLGLGEWILIYYWKLQLKKAFSLGIYKTYQKKRDIISTIRGAININSILRKEYFEGKTDCEFKEHSYKNELNSVINMALNKVFKSKYQPIVSDIYNIKNAFNSINNKNLNLKAVQNKKVINSYFKKYNQVFDLSLKILRDEFANVGESKSEFSAFIFDISLLFEHHIKNVLKQRFTLFPKNKKEFFIPNGIYENHIYPDVIIDYGNDNVGVYDVKYKNFDFLNGVKREDKFQLITYVATHLNKYNVVECGIIYPLKESDFDKTLEMKNQMLKIDKKEIPFKIGFYKICNDLKKQTKIDKEFWEQLSPAANN